MPAAPLRRIALVGPVEPFRGGIAQYTTRLHRALSGMCDVRTVSFKRQYPKWLYPGKTDQEPGAAGRLEPGVRYTLDALNPFTVGAAARWIAAQGCELAAIDWWTLFWAPGFAHMASKLRRRGVPVLFVCHNLFDHDSGGLKRAITTRLLSRATAYLVHSRVQQQMLEQIFPGKTVLMHPLPTFDGFPAAVAPPQQRGRLELLFFGFIRPYKGLDSLIEALTKLADTEVYLTVVGEPWCKPEELRARVQASGAPNIELHLEYVDESAMARFFARADLVVLPYRTETPSAVAALAYHFDRPILATRVNGLKDVVEEGHTGWLVDPDSPEQLAARLGSLDRPRLQQMRLAVRDYKSRFNWQTLAAAVFRLAGEIGHA